MAKMFYCKECKKDIDFDALDDTVYVADIFEGQPHRGVVIVDLSCPECYRTLLEGDGQIELYLSD